MPLFLQKRMYFCSCQCAISAFIIIHINFIFFTQQRASLLLKVSESQRMGPKFCFVFFPVLFWVLILCQVKLCLKWFSHFSRIQSVTSAVSRGSAAYIMYESSARSEPLNTQLHFGLKMESATFGSNSKFPKIFVCSSNFNN